jgi:hypothetical protein
MIEISLYDRWFSIIIKYGWFIIIILLASSPVASAVIQVLFNPYVLEVNPIPLT